MNFNRATTQLTDACNHRLICTFDDNKEEKSFFVLNEISPETYPRVASARHRSDITIFIRRVLIALTIIFSLASCGNSKQIIIVKHEDWKGYKPLQNMAYKYLPIADARNEHMYKIFVIESESTTPWVSESIDGYYSIYFTTKMLSLLDEKELAFVFCHEVAHRLKGHYERKQFASIGMSVGAFFIGFLIPGLGLVDSVTNSIVVRNLSDEQEYEADMFALEIVAKFGITNKQCGKALQKLYNTESTESMFAYSTDQLINERIGRILDCEKFSIEERKP